LGVYVKWIVEFAALMFTVICGASQICEALRKKRYDYRKKAVYLISIIGSLLMTVIGGMSIWTARGCALLLVLLFASICDKNARQVGDICWLMIAFLGLTAVTENSIVNMLLGGVVVFASQMIIAVATKKSLVSIGGADIKISTAASFLLGFYKGIIGFMLGMLIAIIAQLIITRKNHKDRTEAFPLIPYLSVGLLIGYLI